MEDESLHQQRFTSLFQLFDDICDLPTLEQRARLLSVADPRLRSALAGMLAADGCSQHLLTAGAGGALVSMMPQELREPPTEPVPVGAFVLEAPIGMGGMGEVWQGHARRGGERVAVKLLRAARHLQPSFVAAFSAEVKAIARLHHPHIVPVYDYGTLSADAAAALSVPVGGPWLAMALLDGGSLASAVRLAVPWPVLRGVLLELLDALAHAHACGILHLDIKPANILIASAEGGGIRTLLADFGLAHLAAGETGGIGGTLPFMSPEQRAGAWRSFGSWTDLFAVGVLGWQLLHGALPTEVPRWSPRGAVPPAVEGWLQRLMAPAIADRFAHPADAMQALLDIAPTPAPAPWLRACDLRPRADTPPREAILDAGRGLYGLRALPLLGRAAERAALWDHVQAPAVGACLLQGGAGLGKSRLAQWVCERSAETNRARPFVAAVDTEGIDSLRQLLDGALRSRDLEGEALDTHLSAQLGALAAPARALLRPTPAPPPPPTMPWQILRALAGPDMPVVVWIDDAHRSIAVLRAIEAGLAADLGAMRFIVTLQDEQLAESPDAEAAVDRLIAAGAVVMPVAPLASAEHEAVMAAALHLAPSLARIVAERTDGNPLFAVQLIGDWVERDLLEVSPSGFVLPARTAVELPESLQRVWAQRLARLYTDVGPGAEIALELAATLGGQIRTEEWTTVCSTADTQIPTSLPETLLRRRLAHATDEGLALSHSLLRDAICAQARAGGRWASHSRICAEMLYAQIKKRNSGPLLERISRLFLDGGDRYRAAEALLRASGAHYIGGDNQRCDELLAQWPAVAQDVGVPASDLLWGTYLLEVGMHAHHQGQFANAEAAYREALDGADQYGWPHRARALSGLALNMELRQDLDAALRYRREAIALSDDPLSLALENLELARMLISSQPAEARAAIAYSDAIPLADSAQTTSLRARARHTMAQLHCQYGELAAAREASLDAHARYQKINNISGQFQTIDTLLNIAAMQDMPAEAAHLMVDFEQLGARLGGELLRGVTVQRHQLAAFFGDPAQQHGLLQQDIAAARAAGAVWILPEYERLTLLTAAAAGDWACWDETLAVVSTGRVSFVEQDLVRRVWPWLATQPERAAALQRWVETRDQQAPT